MKKRFLLAIAGVGAIVAALLGPLGATAAAPWVYVCTPLQATGGQYEGVYIYNAQTATASVAIRILSADKTVLNSTLTVASDTPAIPTVNFSIPAGNTKIFAWQEPAIATGFGWESAHASTTPVTIRISSDQSLGVGLQTWQSTNLGQPCNFVAQ